MRRLIKFCLFGLISLVLLLLALVIGALIFINPNDYKPQMTAAIEKETGHRLTIEGDLKLQFYPWLGFSVDNIEIDNPKGFKSKQLAKIKQAAIKMQTLSLLQGRIKLDTILLDGLALNLERNAKGQENWIKSLEQSTSGSPLAIKPKTDTPTSNPKKPVSLEIANLAISNASIHFMDTKAQQDIVIDAINLKSHDIKQTHSFVLAGDFNVKSKQKESAQITNRTEFKGELKWLPEYSGFTFTNLTLSTNLKGKDIPNEKLAFSVSSNLKANFSKSTVDIENIILKLDDSTAKGNIALSAKKALNINVNLAIDKLNLDHYRLATLAEHNDPHLAAAIEGKPRIVKVSVSPSVGNINLQGKVSIGHLVANKLSFNKVDFALSNQNKTLYFKPLTTHLYEGQFSGQASLNMARTTPTFGLKGALNKVNVALLLKDLTGESKLSGVGNVSTDITLGPNGLNGTSGIRVMNGYLEGVDVDYYLKLARATLKKLDKPKDNRHRSDYHSLTATLRADGNIVKNNDLIMEANDFTATGAGEINLNSNQINYKLMVKQKYHDGLEHPNAIPLAIRINGSLNDPKVTPDLDAYLQVLVERELKNQLGKQLDKVLGTQETESSQDVNGAQEKSIDNKIEKEIQKGLDKLFKF